MGFTLKVEGNESLFYGENIVQMVTASFDTPNNVWAKLIKSHLLFPKRWLCIKWYHSCNRRTKR